MQILIMQMNIVIFNNVFLNFLSDFHKIIFGYKDVLNFKKLSRTRIHLYFNLICNIIKYILSNMYANLFLVHMTILGRSESQFRD